MPNEMIFTARTFADLLRGFPVISSRDASTGFFVRSSARPSLAIVRNARFTIPSSIEWNVMIAARPPGFTIAPRFASSVSRFSIYPFA